MDKLLRGVFKDRAIRVSLVDSSITSAAICSRHHTTPVVSDALSRLTSVGAMMSGMIKDGRLTLKISGNGPIKQMVVDATSEGVIRGFVANPSVDLPLNGKGKLDVGTAVGDLGVLTVIKKLGLKQDFSGDVILTNGEIGDDFCYYFYKSEQTPSMVAVGTLIDVDSTVKYAGGMILQLLPNAMEEDIIFLEDLAKHLKPITQLLAKNKSLESIIEELFQQQVEILDIKPIKFECDCCKEKFIAGIATLPRQEIVEMLQEEHGCEVRCEFCGNVYNFDEQDLQTALQIKEGKR